MTNKKRASLQKLEKMEELTFKNALRLHFDSIMMYKNHSYPTAYFLSILALEELGKASLLDDFIWHSRIEGRTDISEQEKWLETMYLHKPKQRLFSKQFWSLMTSARKVLRDIDSGKIEIDKQNAVYVSLPKKSRKIELKGRISTPFNVTSKKAKEQITVVSDYLATFTLGVMKGVHGADNPRIERLLNSRLLSKLRKQWHWHSHEAELLLSTLKATT